MRITRRQFAEETIQRILMTGGVFYAGHAIAASFKERRKDRLPGYLQMKKRGSLAKRADDAFSIFESCRLCPRQCGVNRLRGERGFCDNSNTVRVAAAHPHFGEELSLTGENGSGTIFFSRCNLRCVFCQNWPIAHQGKGEDIGDEQLAEKMLWLQKLGCHNINLVTPTHVMPNILRATLIACEKGLSIPLVYNTSGYERAVIIRLLDGIVDIYLPDLKYMDGNHAARYSRDAADYPESARNAILEMHRQVGTHRMNDQGIAVNGLMIRHLVMPNRIAGTRQFVTWVSENLPKETYVNIMPQYHVAYKAYDYAKIARSITVEEYLEAMTWAEAAGLSNLDPRSIESRNRFAARDNP